MSQTFLDFHTSNPEVLYDLIDLTKEFRAAKECKYLSARMIYEYYRGHRYKVTKGEGEFKLNNNHLPHYARLIMQTEPALAGVFRLRKLKVQILAEDEDELSLAEFGKWAAIPEDED